MDLRKRFFGLTADRDDRHVVQVYLDEFLDRLLLFDTYILDSIRLREISAMVRSFGYEPTALLLRDPSLEIHADAVFIAHASQALSFEPMAVGRLRVMMHFGTVTVERDRMLSASYAEFDQLPVAKGERDELRRLVASKLHPRYADSATIALDQFKLDVERNVPALQSAVGVALQRRLVAQHIDTSRLSVHFYRHASGAIEAITNLSSEFHVSQEVAADIVASGALATASACQNIEKMQRFTCTVGGRERELPILDERLSFLSNSIDPESQVRRFHRVLNIAALPRLDANKIDLPKFLEVRHGRECQEFRDWLWSSGSLPEAELRERVTDLKSRVGSWLHSDVGKTTRWAANVAIGSIPFVGGLLGATAGALDSFLVDKVLPQSGVITFLGEQYPSLFSE